MSGVRIGVFDSGLGGLSVARALLAREPSASIIYFADIHHVPYGDRPLEEVKTFALAIVDYLLAQGTGAILMGCNISSAVALDEARLRHPGVPIAGVIEAGARAALRDGAERVAVLATAGTVRSGGYVRAISRIAPDTQVVQTACPEFVPLIEAGELDGPHVREAVSLRLAPGLQRGIAAFILGCTHYPFLLPVMRSVAPEGVRFVDPAEEAVSEILEKVEGRIDRSASRRFVLSAPSETFRPVGSRFLGCALLELELATWDADGTALIDPAVSEGCVPSACGPIERFGNLG